MVMDKDDYTKKEGSYLYNGKQIPANRQRPNCKTRIKDVLKNGVIVSERTTLMNPIAPMYKGFFKFYMEARPTRPLVQDSKDCCKVLEGKLPV